MKTADALKVLGEYYDKSNPTEDDEFLFVEALGYLISTMVISQRQRVLSLQRAFLLLQLQFRVTETVALK